MTKYAKKHPYLLLLLLAFIVIVLLGVRGYRLQPNLTVAKNGSLEILLQLASTSVYVDSKKIITTQGENETVKIPLRVRDHEVIIGRAGYFPWTKKVAIPSDTVVKISPLFVTQTTTGQIVTKNDPEYFSIRANVNATILPTREKPRQQGNATLWAENNSIVMSIKTDTGEKTFTILTPKDTLRSLDFYKDRTDAVIFAGDRGIYAVEAIEDADLNKANFYPLYTGARPLFLKTDNSFIYVLDGENLMMVVV
ncbi:MAG: hypothetical protein NTV02_03940 [Candidatus Zambryskibacteria bacterium]|nr:hypothetical protein [Candidatus Zambryskibacteria bacterium]